MAEHETDERAECPSCKKRSLLRAVIDEARGVLAGEPMARESAEFQICPVCGWNDLPEKHGGRR